MPHQAHSFSSMVVVYFLATYLNVLHAIATPHVVGGIDGWTLFTNSSNWKWRNVCQDLLFCMHMHSKIFTAIAGCQAYLQQLVSPELVQHDS